MATQTNIQEKGKTRVRREENISGHPQKKYVNNFWIRIRDGNGFSKLTGF
jgi:hypothetical protein